MGKLPNLIFAVLMAVIILDKSLKGDRSISDNGLLWVIMVIALVDALVFYIS